MKVSKDVTKDFLTLRQAGEILSVSGVTMGQYISREMLPAQKFGNMWVITRDDLAVFAKKPRPIGYPAGRPRI